MLDRPQIDLLRESFALLAPAQEAALDGFCEMLMRTAPAGRSPFAGNLAEQGRRVWVSVVRVIDNIERPERLDGPLRRLGARHAEAGATPEQFGLVCDALHEAVAAASGPAWTPAHAAAWATLLDFVGDRMLDGALEAAA